MYRFHGFPYFQYQDKENDEIQDIKIGNNNIVKDKLYIYIGVRSFL